MKHLKTFENFNSVDEGIGSDILSFSKKKLGIKTKEEEFKDMLDKFIVAYSKRMKKMPTDAEIEKVMDLAKEDNYDGKPGLSDGMVLRYRKSDDISWKSGGHTFGSGE
jgi:hypothetical protein